MKTDRTNLHFKIHGMDCAEEVALLKEVVGPVVGGEDRLTFDILRAKMTVQTVRETSAERILEAVRRGGLRAEAWQDEADGDSPGGVGQPRGRMLATVLSGVALGVGFGLHASMAGGLFAALGSEGLGRPRDVPLAAIVPYFLAIVCGGWYVAPKAWAALKLRRPDMNVLMTIAVVGAIGIGEWLEAATVAFLFAVALALEAWSVGRARRAIRALMDLAPPRARVRGSDGREAEMAAEQVAVGSLFVVRPGERIPLDGRVLRGASAVNQAPITGESFPVPKEPGSTVFAGTINGDGVLEAESTRAAEDTTLAHIIRLVGEAQGRRAPSERWVERFARVYTPGVFALAIGVALLPPLVTGGNWIEWLYRALVLLVIGCPCALVISTPVTVVAALTAAARNGVLVKGGVHIETPGRLRAVALDKTGTLTEGRPVVVELIPLDEHSEKDLLELAAGMESCSDHPLARAIVACARDRDVTPVPVEGFQLLQGRGATARIDGERYWLGSHRYLEDLGQETPELHRRLEAMSSAGRSVVVLGCDTHVCGLIGIADRVRPEAKRALTALRESGVGHIIMLTGDNRATAEAIAEELGIDEVRAELLPADKIAAIEELVSSHGVVAMVGDGVNDAPALARANLGIAMGAAGSDAAIETADVALMGDDLAALPWLVRHSRRTVAIIRQNIVLSLSIKGLFVVLAFAGYAALWAAIAADMGVSLFVIANALRLLRGGSVESLAGSRESPMPR